MSGSEMREWQVAYAQNTAAVYEQRDRAYADNKRLHAALLEIDKLVHTIALNRDDDQARLQGIADAVERALPEKYGTQNDDGPPKRAAS